MFCQRVKDGQKTVKIRSVVNIRVGRFEMASGDYITLTLGNGLVKCIRPAESVAYLLLCAAAEGARPKG